MEEAGARFAISKVAGTLALWQVGRAVVQSGCGTWGCCGVGEGEEVRAGAGI